MSMNCIVCKKTLENIEYPEGNHPIHGTAFHSIGHYGSGVFDPMDGTFLEINVCDDCLKEAGAERNVMLGFPEPAPPRKAMMHWPVKRAEKAT